MLSRSLMEILGKEGMEREDDLRALLETLRETEKWENEKWKEAIRSLLFGY